MASRPWFCPKNVLLVSKQCLVPALWQNVARLQWDHHCTGGNLVPLSPGGCVRDRASQFEEPRELPWPPGTSCSHENVWSHGLSPGQRSKRFPSLVCSEASAHFAGAFLSLSFLASAPSFTVPSPKSGPGATRRAGSVSQSVRSPCRTEVPVLCLCVLCPSALRPG